MVFPYVKGASESLRRCIQQQGIHAVFKSDTTLRLHLVRPQDIINPARQDSVLYRIPCECGKIYIRRNRKTYVREEERTREGIYVWPVPRPPPFLNTLTRPVIPALERSKVYWSRLTLVHQKSQGSYPHRTSLWSRQEGWRNRNSWSWYQRSSRPETGTTANCPGNKLESDLLENQNSPERWGSKSANRIRSPWYKW